MTSLSWNDQYRFQRRAKQSDLRPPPWAISFSSPLPALLQLHCPFSVWNPPCLCPLWALHTQLPVWRAQLCIAFCSADYCFCYAVLFSSLVQATLTILSPLQSGSSAHPVYVHTCVLSVSVFLLTLAHLDSCPSPQSLLLPSPVQQPALFRGNQVPTFSIPTKTTFSS